MGCWNLFFETSEKPNNFFCLDFIFILLCTYEYLYLYIYVCIYEYLYCVYMNICVCASDVCRHMSEQISNTMELALKTIVICPKWILELILGPLKESQKKNLNCLVTSPVL